MADGSREAAEEVPSSKGEVDPEIGYGESRGKGTETTQTRSKDDPLGGDVPGDLVKRRLPTGASPHSGADRPGTRG